MIACFDQACAAGSLEVVVQNQGPNMPPPSGRDMRDMPLSFVQVETHFTLMFIEMSFFVLDMTVHVGYEYGDFVYRWPRSGKTHRAERRWWSHPMYVGLLILLPWFA